MRYDILGDAVGEILVLGIRTEAQERQHCHGRSAGSYRGRCGERLRERGGRRKPVGGGSGERFHQRLFDPGRNRAPQAPHGGDRIGEPLGQDGLRRAPRVGRLAGEQLIQHAAETVDVATRIELPLAQRLLGTHVLGRAHREPNLREPLPRRGAHGQGDPEIGDHRLAFIEQDVFRLDVPMDDVLRVRVPQGGGDISGDTERLLNGELFLPRQPVAQRFACHVRHDVEQKPVRFTGVVQRQDVGMIQPGGDLHLTQKPIGPEGRRHLRAEHLDRHPTVMLDVVREIDGGHAAAPQLSLDDIAAGEGGVEAVALISLHGSSSKIIDWPRNPPAGPAIRPRYAVQKGPTLRVRATWTSTTRVPWGAPRFRA